MSEALEDSSTIPSISVIVPCFNESPEVLHASLGSLRAQSWTDFECLVIDESTDTVKAEAVRAFCREDPRFIYLRPETRIGLAASLNLGLTGARGRLVARFDSDDLCMPGRLAVQATFMAEHPEIGVLGGGLEIMDESGATRGYRHYPETHDKIASRMMFTNTIAHPTVMFRKNLVEAYGDYNPMFRYSEDLDLWLRWLNCGVRFANLPDVIVRYRQAITSRNNNHWAFNLKARRKNFSTRFLLRRLAGIILVAAWTLLPSRFQDLVFRILLFRRKRFKGI